MSEETGLQDFRIKHRDESLAFIAAFERLKPGERASEVIGGWSASEMAAHVAFWNEAAVPVIRHMWRGQEIPMPWQFGSGLFDEPAWPSADAHNAREAAWARGVTSEAIVERLRAAHEALQAELATSPSRSSRRNGSTTASSWGTCGSTGVSWKRGRVTGGCRGVGASPGRSR